MKLIVLLLLLTTPLAHASTAFDTVVETRSISVVSYNLLNFDASDTNKVQYFRTILEELDPDIVVVQEMVNQGGVELFLEEALNFNEEEYAVAEFYNGYDTDNALYYKEERIDYEGMDRITTALRDINAYYLDLDDKDVPFVIYSAHLKASQGSDNENKRYNEVLRLKLHADMLPTNHHYMVVGDFNIYTNEEPAYQLLMNGFDNDLYDPIERPGNWHNNWNFRDIHTQSTRTTQFGGGASGGLDDRFDFILLSEAFSERYGLIYIEDSYIAYGNDANHFNQDINAGTNTAVSEEIADALYYGSDHLPVVAGFEYYVKYKRPKYRYTMS